MHKIESLLSARLMIQPKLVGERIFFMSDLTGRLSLYVMDKSGSIPEPLLPPDIALQNPALLEGEPYLVLPKLKKILIMLDQDGNENYEPCWIDMDGGIPEPIFGDRFQGQQVFCEKGDLDRNLVFFTLDPRTDPTHETFLADLGTLELTSLGTSIYGNWSTGGNQDLTRVLLLDAYSAGDHVLYLWEKERGERRLLYGKPLEDRQPDETVPVNSINHGHFTSDDQGALFVTSLFQDAYGLGYLDLETPGEVREVAIIGAGHTGNGELQKLEHLYDERYLVTFNIDGSSFVYAGTFDPTTLQLVIDRTLVGTGRLSNGVLESINYEKASKEFVLSFPTATSPTQIFSLRGDEIVQHTRERILGIPDNLLSPGEDASYLSHDGLRISARLYLPAAELNFHGRRPVVYYLHGGPQSQERPDFGWFSMPLIQFLTLNGFAVFVPNARGSSGYGLEFMKRVDHDWGGQDRLDHVAGVAHLAKDERLDTTRIGVMGRSYGGYMTLTLAGRHPDLWTAACDMFGPYDLFTFIDRLPETWKTYFYLAVGHPEKERDLLIDRSPKTYLHQLACPLLVIQGKNDPRVVEAESRDLVTDLRAQGKEVEYLMFENEGHDVLKFENKVRCFNNIVSFFTRVLQP